MCGLFLDNIIFKVNDYETERNERMQMGLLGMVESEYGLDYVDGEDPGNESEYGLDYVDGEVPGKNNQS